MTNPIQSDIRSARGSESRENVEMPRRRGRCFPASRHFIIVKVMITRKWNVSTLVVFVLTCSAAISVLTTFHLDQDLRGQQSPVERSPEDHPLFRAATTTTSVADDDSASSNVSSSNNITMATLSGGQWRPSREWIDGCVRELEASKLEPFNVVWRRYVLGDCIKQCRNCYTLKCVRHPEKTKQKGSGCYQKPSRNDTFASLYHFRACKANQHVIDGNLTIVDQILKEAETRDPSFARPPPDTLVMHLRLGDVIENSKSNVADMLARGGDPWHTDTYKSAIKSIDEYLSDIESSGLSKIVVRGGSHDPNHYQKSRVYAGCLTRAIQNAGYTSISIKLEGSDPDHDFYYIGWAKHLSVSSGGFSRLMGTMAKRHGGRMVGREFIKYHSLATGNTSSTTASPS